MAQYQLIRALRSNLKTFYGLHLHLAERCCENLHSARCQIRPRNNMVGKCYHLQRWSRGHKARGQGQPFRGQTLSRPRTQAQVLSKKKVFTKIFQAVSTKKRFPKNFSSAPQNFNNSKNTAVLEPRTGQFSRTRGQGLHNVSSRTPPLTIYFTAVYFNNNSLIHLASFYAQNTFKKISHEKC